MSLWEDFLGHSGRPVFKWAHYFPAYERHLSPFRNRPVTLWEIGCGKGGSLQMWKRWLGPAATIVGLDIRPECAAFEEMQVHVRIGDQKDEAFLGQVLGEFGAPDAIVDDGSHRMEDVIASFGYLYPRLAKAGIYLVEDMHTAYWEEYGGGLGRPGSFLELCKSLIDELNAHHSRGAVAPTSFTEGTGSMHFYDSMVVFERAPRMPSAALEIGKGRARKLMETG